MIAQMRPIGAEKSYTKYPHLQTEVNTDRQMLLRGLREYCLKKEEPLEQISGWHAVCFTS